MKTKKERKDSKGRMNSKIKELDKKIQSANSAEEELKYTNEQNELLEQFIKKYLP